MSCREGEELLGRPVLAGLGWRPGRSVSATVAFCVLVTCTVIAGMAPPAKAQGARPPAGAPAAKAVVGLAPPAKVALPASASYVLVDVNTGYVLAGYHEHLRVPPASLTKILTALIAVTFLPADAGVPGTRQSLTAYPNDVGIEKGVAWPLDDVLQALLVYSANDAAYAIAQRISGSLAAFGPVMDLAARQVGMSDDPVFHDPAGLDGTEGIDGGNLVSARDLAIAGRDLLHVPELAQMVKEPSYYFVDPTGAPHDLPSMDYAFLDSYPGAIGIKTGFTDRAGSCIMAAATRDGRTMLAVVMNGYNPTQSATDLLGQGFATPIAREPKGDQLPAVTLPGLPPLAVAKTSRSSRARPAHIGTTELATGSSRATLLARRSAARPAKLRRAAAPGHPARAGLAAVVQSWPAQTLLLLAGVAAVLSLWELVSADRTNRRRRQWGGPPMVGGFSTNRKRREQLIASYRRHERQAGLAQAAGRDHR